jgi:hypothetical protein
VPSSSVENRRSAIESLATLESAIVEYAGRFGSRLFSVSRNAPVRLRIARRLRHDPHAGKHILLETARTSLAAGFGEAEVVHVPDDTTTS